MQTTTVQPTTRPRLLTSDMMRDEYGFMPTELKSLRERRLLAFVKLGHRSIRYKRKDVERLIDSHRVAAIGECMEGARA